MYMNNRSSILFYARDCMDSKVTYIVHEQKCLGALCKFLYKRSKNFQLTQITMLPSFLIPITQWSRAPEPLSSVATFTLK